MAQQFLVPQEWATKMCAPTSLGLLCLLAEAGLEQASIVSCLAPDSLRHPRREWKDQTCPPTSHAIAFCQFLPASEPFHPHDPARRNSNQGGRASHPTQTRRLQTPSSFR